MRLSENKVRKIVRQEIKTVLQEQQNLSNVGQRIYNDVQDALQDAEEIWGLGDSPEEYVQLMKAVRDHVEERMRRVKQHHNI